MLEANVLPAVLAPRVGLGADGTGEGLDGDLEVVGQEVVAEVLAVLVLLVAAGALEPRVIMRSTNVTPTFKLTSSIGAGTCRRL